jgi:hypothetical protein
MSFAISPVTPGIDSSFISGTTGSLTCFRATQSDIEKLFEWASNSHDRTYNQRIRPGLLIIVNNSSPPIEHNRGKWLDPNYATEKLLNAIDISESFPDQCEEWRRRGRDIRSARDLILCYYESFRVVHIPTLSYATAEDVTFQHEKLYREIRQASTRLRETREQLGMSLNTTAFVQYMDHAFNRLAKDIRKSINFYYLSYRGEEVPSKFSDHLTSLIAAVQEDQRPDGLGQERELLNQLRPYIAGCVVLHTSNQQDGSGMQTFQNMASWIWRPQGGL